MCQQLMHTLQVSNPHGRKNHKREDNTRTIPSKRGGAHVNKRTVQRRYVLWNSADSVSAVYRGPKKNVKLKK
jgi:hypothetical protein